MLNELLEKYTWPKVWLQRSLAVINYLLALFLFIPYLTRYYLLRRHLRRLHLGCGKVRLAGWVNADINPRAELIVDLRWPLPFPSNYLQRIYSEHVLEHVSYKTGVRFLREARRVLAPGGVMRIAMPDLDRLVEKYRDNWRDLDWVNWPAHSFIKTRAEMMNIAFRSWGHKYLYNKEEIARALREAGFSSFYFLERLGSPHNDLRGLETRQDSNLVVEALK